MNKTLAYIFPGQGAQFVGMGQDFAAAFPVAKETFEEADDQLKRSLSRVIFEGPEAELTRTDQSQLAIFVTSVAILRVLNQITPQVKPGVTAGLSLGEYTALYQSGMLDFASCLELVERRGHFMSEACDLHKGTMAVVMGMSVNDVEQLVRDLALPHDLWAANFNCPGQVVVSGTLKGIEAAKEEALKRGARRVLPLQVHGAFHSGLMESARQQLNPYVQDAPLKTTSMHLVMNVPGDFVADAIDVRRYLVDQVTSPVRWEQGVRAMQQKGVTTYVEIGPGKTLTGMNKRIGIEGQFMSLGQVEDLRHWEQEVEAWSKC